MSSNVKKEVQKVADKTAWNPMRLVSSWGVRSNHAYTAGLLSVGVSLATWLVSRGKNDAKSQSDRWGIFIGQWAPTFFVLGVGLKLEEES
ncbi:hypothetical protein [Leucobacter aridicollis]|uniref:Uncharacterized protein n=1 Tax=Leucobacter aridicollis TaxID=283878 RepID=A0A852R9W0_9MICO|nr:hypothetical protein [Leucobacter aridicollis]NYD26106.1 hypothetical protein [Leucobacter aridicollis]